MFLGRRTRPVRDPQHLKPYRPSRPVWDIFTSFLSLHYILELNHNKWRFSAVMGELLQHVTHFHL
jgi:hypothetical protein